MNVGLIETNPAVKIKGAFESPTKYTYFLSVHKYSLLYIHIFLLDYIYNNMIYINIIGNLNIQFVNNKYVIISLDHNKIFNLTIMIYTMFKVNCYVKDNTKKSG